jgi:single-strand DNA-binding protein
MNNITIVGRLGRDPELRYSKDEKPIAVFSVATDHGRDENKKTSWHNVVAFGSLAENIIKSLHAGTRVIVSGRLDVSDYQGKDGEKKKKHELIADAVGIELRFDAVESYMVADMVAEEVF